MFDMSPAMLISGGLIGLVGFVLFVYGKKESDFSSMAGGVALSVVPVVVHSLAVLWGASIAVIALFAALKRFGSTGGPIA